MPFVLETLLENPNSSRLCCQNPVIPHSSLEAPPSGTNRMRPGIADRRVRLLVDVGLGTAGLPHQNGS